MHTCSIRSVTCENVNTYVVTQKFFGGIGFMCIVNFGGNICTPACLFYLFLYRILRIILSTCAVPSELSYMCIIFNSEHLLIA